MLAISPFTDVVLSFPRVRLKKNTNFDRAICSILYNRGVYPEETFERVKKYGLPLLLSQDEGVKTFISNLHKQLSGKLSVSLITLAPILNTVFAYLIRFLIWGFQRMAGSWEVTKDCTCDYE